MSNSMGTSTFVGSTGSRTLNLGMACTWMEIDFGSSTVRHSMGYTYGGASSSYPDSASGVDSTNIIHVKDNSGTDVLVGSFTGFVGNNATFNMTVIPNIGGVQGLLRFGN